MGFFISKKQQHVIKERRKKKLLAEKGILPKSVDNDADVPSMGSKKRPLDHDDDDDDDDGKHNVELRDNPQSRVSKETSLPHKAKSVVVRAPSNLSNQEARKYRKEARRKARLEGSETVVFVTEREEREQQAKKKPKRIFPNLNEIIKKEKQSKQEAAVQQERDDLSDEYKSRYVALDCEMVGIGSDGRQSALARVSIVNWNGETLLDTFVQVPTKVTDFRTFVSGVKPKHIQGTAAMNENTCRKTVAALIQGKIVVGHALKNDWHALMLQHPASQTRDTAHYRPFQRLANNKWRPRKLRDLVKEHCALTIQEAGQSHDSVDDAGATMKLFQTVHVAWEKELELKSKKKALS